MRQHNSFGRTRCSRGVENNRKIIECNVWKFLEGLVFSPDFWKVVTVIILVHANNRLEGWDIVFHFKNVIFIAFGCD